MGVPINNWQDVQSEVLNRIHSKLWKPGEQIPNEVELAKEFGCARATVNRALRAVAEAGYLDRKRKAGTRVALHPVRKATFSIPIVRQEIEARGQAYTYALISSGIHKPSVAIRAKMNLDPKQKAHRSAAMHFADHQPFATEDRWINLDTVPEIRHLDLANYSANEWLVANAPFTHANLSFMATAANAQLAERLAVKESDALFALDRTTWDGDRSITNVKLVFHPGYALHTIV